MNDLNKSDAACAMYERITKAIEPLPKTRFKPVLQAIVKSLQDNGEVSQGQSYVLDMFQGDPRVSDAEFSLFFALRIIRNVGAHVESGMLDAAVAKAERNAEKLRAKRAKKGAR